MFGAAVLSSLLFVVTPQASACPVTRPALPPRFGNGRISTDLWPDGVVTFRKSGPGFVLRDGALRMKFLWFLAGDGPLTVSGRRLDGAAPPLRSDIAHGYEGQGFQPSYLIFPTQGCWEVTARANGSELTFVTKVVKTF